MRMYGLIGKIVALIREFARFLLHWFSFRFRDRLLVR